MTKRLVICALAVVLAAGLALAQAKQNAPSTWTGWITDTHCGAQKNYEKHADCARKCVQSGMGKWALYNPADKKVYTLEPGDKVAPLAGKHVKVSGTVAGDTIKLTAIEATGEQKGK
jgi:hypothetical protein